MKYLTEENLDLNLKNNPPPAVTIIAVLIKMN